MLKMSKNNLRWGSVMFLVVVVITIKKKKEAIVRHFISSTIKKNHSDGSESINSVDYYVSATPIKFTSFVKSSVF